MLFLIVLVSLLHDDILFCAILMLNKHSCMRTHKSMVTCSSLKKNTITWILVGGI